MNIIKRAVNTDMSLPAMQELLAQGYDTVMFRAAPEACDKCQMVDGDTRNLEEWLAGLVHNAPVFEFSHPNCVDRVFVSGPGLPNVSVDWTGTVEQI